MRMRTVLVAICLVGSAVLVGPSASSAQVYGGVQANYGSETDFGLGARMLANLEDVNLEFVGSFDLYFPDGPSDFWEINGNVFYHFHLPESPSILPYIGGGLNVGHVSNGADNTEAGLNLGGGVRFPLENVSPFIEARTVVSDFDQSVLTFGLVFGHAHGL